MPLVALLLALCGSARGAVDFEKDIRPVLEHQCLVCHSGSKVAGGVRLDTRAAALRNAIVAGKPDESPMVRSIELSPNKPGAMPPGGPQIPAATRAAIREWIKSGATWPDSVHLSNINAETKRRDDRQEAAELHRRIVAGSHVIAAAAMRPYKMTIPGTEVAFEMTPIPAGSFRMGTPETERGHKKDEEPVHDVRIEPFWMATHEVTWDEYRLFMFAQQAGELAHKDELVDAVSRPTRPYVEMSFGMGLDGFPAISMTQHAANKYAEWLSAKTGQFYRLPTEAEWEYACRAGATTAYPFGDDPQHLAEYAWYSANSDGKYQKVGTKKPNAWGLYDMLGNVMEWTLDQYIPNFYAQIAGHAETEPWAKATKPYPHSVRGGSWNDDALALRCGARTASEPSWKMQDPQLPKSIWYHTDAQWLGFRLIRPLKIPTAEQMYLYWNNGVEKD
jgi:formylglycine-generating enzyme required for sulfatase activity